jgi:hypothetical protein
MKILLVFLAVGLASRSLPAAPVAAEVTSAEALKAVGVTCRRIELQALTASVEIEVTVDESRAPGKYEGAECVILKEPLSVEKLPAVDAAASDGGTVARRARFAKPNPVFLVLGREIPRAYLAFEFSVQSDSAGTITRRYLLPVSAIDARPAEPTPEHAAWARDASVGP